MATEFNFTLVYRLVELVCMVGTLLLVCVTSYIQPKPLAGDENRPFCRYLMALAFGYIFVLTADVAARFLGGGVAAIAMFAFTVTGFGLFTATAASLGYAYYKITLVLPLIAILAFDSLLLAIDAILTYARVQRTSLVTAPRLNLR